MLKQSTLAVLAILLAQQSLARAAADAAPSETAPAATSPSPAEMLRQIQALQAQVQQLQQQQQQQAVDTKTVDDTVARVMQDADKHSKMMELEGFTAGWNNGRFMVGSADGDFTLMPFLQIQFRSTTNFDTGGSNTTENGFSFPRVKLGFDGTVYHKLSYFFRWNSGDSDGGGSGALNLEQAWGRYQWTDDWAIRAGQFVDPVFHEQLVGSERQLAADRSLMNEILTGADESYTQGVTAIWTPDPKLNVEIGFTDGINSGNTSFRDFPVNSADFGFAGRAEFAALGSATDQYRDFSAMGNKEEILVFGAGFDWSEAGDTDNFLHTFDVQWEDGTGKLGVYGAYVGQFIGNGGGAGITGVTGGNDDSYNEGLLVQASYMISPSWEVFGRYDFTHLDDSIPVGGAGKTEDNFHELTAGVNYFLRGHNAKLTLDISYLPNGAPAGATNLGILSNDDDEIVIRGQFQLML